LNKINLVVECLLHLKCINKKFKKYGAKISG